MEPITLLTADKRKASAAEHFADNPKAETFHVTVDGQCFADKLQAQAHGRDLARGHDDRAAEIAEVITVHRSSVEVPEKGTSTGKAASKGGAKPKGKNGSTKASKASGGGKADPNKPEDKDPDSTDPEDKGNEDPAKADPKPRDNQ